MGRPRFTLRLKALSGLGALFALIALVVGVLADRTMTTKAHELQAQLFTERLDSITTTLRHKQDLLARTGMEDAYRRAFQEAAVRQLAAKYYPPGTASRSQLIIFDDRGAVILHPELAAGDDSLAGLAWVQRSLSVKAGAIEYSHRGEASWGLHTTFEPWGWRILYSTPLSEKYRSVRDFQRAFLLTLWIGGLFLLLSFAGLITLITRPIQKLTAAAARMASGDLDQAVDIRSNDEIGALARSFADMRDAIRAQIQRMDQEITERKRAQESLFELNRTLGERVEARTAALTAAKERLESEARQRLAAEESLREQNRAMRLVLDNVNQGLITLDLDGTVSQERSAVVGRWLGDLPAGETLWKALEPRAPEVAFAFSVSYAAILDDILPLDVVLDQLPHRLDVEGLVLWLDYVPIFAPGGRGPAGPTEKDGRLDQVLVVISDITSRIAQERTAAEGREILAVFEKFLDNQAAFLRFFSESEALVQAVLGDPGTDLRTLMRQVHTLKGTCSLYGLGSITRVCHELEERLKASGQGLTPRDREELGAAWAQVSAKLTRLVERQGPADVIVVRQPELEQVVQALTSGAPRREILDTLADWRWPLVRGRLSTLADLARDLCARLGKGPITVEVQDQGVRLPEERFGGFFSALVHVVRNAVDHGLETARERAAAGKDERARVELSARVEPGQVVIEVRDNGRGVDWEQLGRRARERGLPHATRADLESALFTDGVSTRDEATELSGRGVGLAAVRQEVEQVHGQIKVDSELGVGTTFQFRFPLARGLRMT